MGLMDMFAKWSYLAIFWEKFIVLLIVRLCLIVNFFILFYGILRLQSSLIVQLCNCYHVDCAIVQLLPCWSCNCDWKFQNLHIDCAIVQKFAFWLCDCVKICILILRLCENMQFDCALVQLCLIVLIVCDCVVYPEPPHSSKN